MSGQRRAAAAWSEWRIALTHPASVAADVVGCQPTVESRSRRWDLVKDDPDPHSTEYRGACLRCGWRGPERHEENLATEDAHDHSHPEWRGLPTVSMPKGWPDGAPRAAEKARLRAIEMMGPAMPGDWPARLGPVVTLRSGIGTRHVPGRSPFGGYDMARVAPEGPAQAPREQLVETGPPKQLELAL
ncbi:MAG TPA: DUF6349 family protein [Myxococcaceae bacterium]|nr:DUF6349 family protein [Myxococcaceae bacterium]